MTITPLIFAALMSSLSAISAVESAGPAIIGDLCDVVVQVQGACWVDKNGNSVGEFPNLATLIGLIEAEKISVPPVLAEAIKSGKRSKYGIESAGFLISIATPVAVGDVVWGSNAMTIHDGVDKGYNANTVDLSEGWVSISVVDVNAGRIWCAGGGGRQYAYEIPGLAKFIKDKDGAGFAVSWTLMNMEKTVAILQRKREEQVTPPAPK